MREEREKLIREHHDCVQAGHPSRERSYFRLRQVFNWSKMGVDITSKIEERLRPPAASSLKGIQVDTPIPIVLHIRTSSDGSDVQRYGNGCVHPNFFH